MNRVREDMSLFFVLNERAVCFPYNLRKIAVRMCLTIAITLKTVLVGVDFGYVCFR